MKIAIAQLNYHIGNFDGNLTKMLDAVEKAKEGHADLICFSELSTCGYPPRDFLEFEDFIKKCIASIDVLRNASEGLGIIVGSPTVNPVPEGKDLYNSAYFLYNQEVTHVCHKALLPTYDIFDEYRYFEPGKNFTIYEFKGVKLALTVCEDIWNIGNNNPLYTVCPMDEMMPQKPELIINISASPFNYTQSSERLHIIKSNVDRYNIPMVYINHCGAQTEILFDGGSVVMSTNGSYYEAPYFKETFKIFELDNIKSGVESQIQNKDKIPLIHDALVMGLRDYFFKLGFSKAILGLSGGIDSAVTACLATRALGAENVRCVLMPSRFSSQHSIDDAEQLCINLGCPYDIIPIEDAFNTFSELLSEQFKGTEFNIAEENIQARSRGVILMALSNKFGNILLNTTNKSEMAVGYGTLYGDLCGGLSVIADLYKMEVYEMASYINRKNEIIPKNTITKPPSAELRANQKDSDSLPDYDILDKILFEYIENRKGPTEIIDLGYEEQLVKRILRMVNMNEFKRYQTAPVLRVSRKAFGMGRRVPIVGKYLS